MIDDPYAELRATVESLRATLQEGIASFDWILAEQAKERILLDENNAALEEMVRQREEFNQYAGISG